MANKNYQPIAADFVGVQKVTTNASKPVDYLLLANEM